MWWVLLVEYLFMFVVAAGLLHQYGNLKVMKWYVTLAVFLTWWINFSPILMTPVDVSGVFYRHCVAQEYFHLHPSTPTDPTPTVTPTPTITPTDVPIITTTTTTDSAQPTNENEPIRRHARDVVFASNQTYRNVPADFVSTCARPSTYVPDTALRVVWKVVYWFTQVMTWMVIPLMSSYVDAGDFEFGAKMRTAFRDNAIMTGSLMVMFGSLFIYIAVKNQLSFAGLVGIAMASSNTWGLTCLVALMGYGLVDLPRRWFIKAQRHRYLDTLYFKAARLHQEVDESIDDLEDALKDLAAVSQVVGQSDSLRPQVEVILAKATYSESSPAGSRRRPSASAHIARGDVDTPMLVSLHRKVIRGVHINERCKAQFETCISQAIDLEDVIGGTLTPHNHPRDNLLQRWAAQVVYVWKMHLVQGYSWVCFVVTSLLSLMVVWSECTFFITHPTLSLSAILMHVFGLRNDHVWVQGLSFVLIVHMTLCVYNTLFRIRVFNYFYLTANHHSDSASLLFSAMCVSRLTPALILNFLSITQLDQNMEGAVPENTAFTQIMGHMSVVPFIANGFMIFFPMVTIGLALASLLRLFNRCLYDEDLTMDLVSDGRTVVKLERRKRGRGGGTARANGQDAVERLRERVSERRQQRADERSTTRVSEAARGIGQRFSSFFGRDQSASDVDMSLLPEDEDTDYPPTPTGRRTDRPQTRTTDPNRIFDDV